MADLSQADLDWIRDWVGSKPSDDALANYYDDLQGKEAVAWRVLSRRRADLLASPASVSISGTLSVSSVANITALDATLNRLMPIAQAAGVDVGGLAGATTSRLRRGRRCRDYETERAEELSGFVGENAAWLEQMGRQVDRGRWQGV